METKTLKDMSLNGELPDTRAKETLRQEAIKWAQLENEDLRQLCKANKFNTTAGAFHYGRKDLLMDFFNISEGELNSDNTNKNSQDEKLKEWADHMTGEKTSQRLKNKGIGNKGVNLK